MLGGGKFPGFSEENRVQYDKSASTQLQLIRHDPTQFGGGGLVIANKVGNEQELTYIPPMKRAREEPVYIQQKLGFSPKDNLYTVEHGSNGFLVNPNHVSSMLRLSSEKEEPTSSITSTRRTHPKKWTRVERKAHDFSNERVRKRCQQETAREGARNREPKPQEQGVRGQNEAGFHGSSVMALQSKVQRISCQCSEEQYSAAHGTGHGPMS